MAVRITDLYFIDDSSDEHLITRLMFKRAGLNITVHEFLDFASFQKLLGPKGPIDTETSIVLIDLNLGLENGIDALKTIRSDGSSGALLAGICSGSNDPADRIDAAAAGADFFVPKPLDANALKDICATVPKLDFVDDPASGPYIVNNASVTGPVDLEARVQQAG